MGAPTFAGLIYMPAAALGSREPVKGGTLDLGIAAGQPIAGAYLIPPLSI